MVTGSHIFDDRNGIRFNRTDAEALDTVEFGEFVQSRKFHYQLEVAACCDQFVAAF